MPRTIASLVAGLLVLGLAPMATAVTIDGPPAHEAAYSWADLGKDLAHLRASLKEAEALIRDADHPDCRNLSPEKTVRCAADTFRVSQEQAVGVWRCESNFGIEPPHSDAYHGPFQFAYLTYASQQESMPDVVRWFELSPAVHDVRSNILTAVAWAARHGWGPWSCA